MQDKSASADFDDNSGFEKEVLPEEKEILVDDEIANREEVIPKDHLELLMVLLSRSDYTTSTQWWPRP